MVEGNMPQPTRIDPLVAQLAARRRELGMTASYLAARIGMQGQHISRYESGACSPSLPNLRRWAWGLGMSIELRPWEQSLIDARANAT